MSIWGSKLYSFQFYCMCNFILHLLQGLLALEGELTPILVSMVKSANTNGLLDKEGETSKYQHM